MHRPATVLAVLAVLIGPAEVLAQHAISDLRTELAAGRVELVSAAGNGSSSGAAVDAVLLNNSASVRRINVSIAAPLLLRNRGAGQSMVAVEVYHEDGGYMLDGQSSFIELRPGMRTAVFFLSYCLDFEKDNPRSSDRLSVDLAPTGLEPVLRRIAEHARRNPNADLTVAAQAAIWLAQGTTMSEIRDKFEVSAAEERLARVFAR